MHWVLCSDLRLMVQRQNLNETIDCYRKSGRSHVATLLSHRTNPVRLWNTRCFGEECHCPFLPDIS